jgi:DNA polymerase III alpha subunit
MSGSCDAVIFPKVYEEFKKFIYNENNVLIMGKLEQKNDSLIVEKIWEI